jgi:hypothetical protein
MLPIKLTFECCNKIEKGNHKDAFDRSIEIGEEKNTSVILFPCGEIEITERCT